jgi:hypothetical protein
MSEENISISYVLPEFPTHVYLTEKKKTVLRKIGFNKMYAGMHWSVRLEVMNVLKAFASMHIKPSKVRIPEPVRIHIEYHLLYNYGQVKQDRRGIIIRPISKGPETCDWDLDNLSVLWRKAITDVLVSKHILSADTANIVSGYTEDFVPSSFENRKIIVTITPYT